jgi:Tfp pilus assembly protein PilO
MTLLRRVAAEKRTTLIVLALAVVANAGAYLFVVRPLATRSAGATDRAAAAAAAAKAAESELAIARELVAGKARADEELAAFYQKILPTDLTAARRMTYASLPALARKTNVDYATRRFDPVDPERNERLARLTIRMILEGEYENLRQFIHQLETAPEFIIIDDVTLSESSGDTALTLRINLSTYYLVPNER